MDVSLQSTSNIKKRNSSPLRQINNSKVKKCKTSINNISSRVNNAQYYNNNSIYFYNFPDKFFM